MDHDCKLLPYLYITQKSHDKAIDIAAVNAQIEASVSQQKQLRDKIDRIVASYLKKDEAA